ncbi:MAG: sugar transferase [Chloroflexota bacterium]|nr:sugar transferase [Chloroflexota bacterium]
MSTVESSTTWKPSRERASHRLSLQVSERRMLLLWGDVFLLGVAGVAALWGWSGIRPDITFTREFAVGQMGWLVALALTWLVVAALNGVYDLRIAARVRLVGGRLLTTAVVLGLLYLLLFFALNTRGAPGDPFAGIEWRLPRVVPVLFLLSTLVLTLTWRSFYALVLTGSNFRRRALVLGAGWAGRTVAGAIASNLQSGYEITGFIDDDSAKQGGSLLGLPVLGTSKDLLRVVLEKEVDELVLSITYEMGGEMFGAIMECYARGVTLIPMPLLYESATGRVPVEHVGSQWYVSLPTYPATTARLSDLLQRLADVLLSLAGLICLVPFFLLIALILYLDCPGPIFYSQIRTGHTGRPFRLYKFRSMIPDAEPEGHALWASANDSRITRFGKIMRRTRLDELPQLWNVLKGDMSLIGPRPERPEFVTELEQEIPFYNVRHLVRPGLSGWAQVRYRYGNSKEDALIKLQYDLYYIKHRSPFLNLLILWKTIGVILRFQGT